MTVPSPSPSPPSFCFVLLSWECKACQQRLVRRCLLRGQEQIMRDVLYYLDTFQVVLHVKGVSPSLAEQVSSRVVETKQKGSSDFWGHAGLTNPFCRGCQQESFLTAVRALTFLKYQ